MAKGKNEVKAEIVEATEVPVVETPKAEEPKAGKLSKAEVAEMLAKIKAEKEESAKRAKANAERLAKVEAVNAQLPDDLDEEERQLLLDHMLGRSKEKYVPRKYRAQYAANGGNNGDEVAKALKEAFTSQAELVDWAEENGFGDKVNGYIDAGRNVGMVRMNLGNLVRGAIKKGATFRVAGTVLNAQSLRK